MDGLFLKAVLAVNLDVPDVLREALDAGLDPRKPVRGKTLVSRACNAPSYGCLELLSERCPEALFEPVDTNGTSPFIAALMRPADPDVRRLVEVFASALPEGCEVEGLCGPGTTPLAEIAEVGDEGWEAGRQATELLLAMGHPPLPDGAGVAPDSVGISTV